jgi:hypothetical protein
MACRHLSQSQIHMIPHRASRQPRAECEECVVVGAAQRNGDCVMEIRGVGLRGFVQGGG